MPTNTNLLNAIKRKLGMEKDSFMPPPPGMGGGLGDVLTPEAMQGMMPPGGGMPPGMPPGGAMPPGMPPGMPGGGAMPPMDPMAAMGGGMPPGGTMPPGGGGAPQMDPAAMMQMVMQSMPPEAMQAVAGAPPAGNGEVESEKVDKIKLLEDKISGLDAQMGTMNSKMDQLLQVLGVGQIKQGQLSLIDAIAKLRR